MNQAQLTATVSNHRTDLHYIAEAIRSLVGTAKEPREVDAETLRRVRVLSENFTHAVGELDATIAKSYAAVER